MAGMLCAPSPCLLNKNRSEWLWVDYGSVVNLVLGKSFWMKES
ncbi:hypothetical protein OAV71_03525 [Opitutales bacterium]|nr:hypothetical protein [Opitutales bacterium]